MAVYGGNPNLNSNMLRDRGYEETSGFNNVVDAVAYGKLGLVEKKISDYKVLNRGSNSTSRFTLFVKPAPYRGLPLF